MGDVVPLHPPRPVIAETFTEVREISRIGPYPLILARSQLNGRDCVSVLLMDLPNDLGFEILGTAYDTDAGNGLMEMVSSAVILAGMHVVDAGL